MEKLLLIEQTNMLKIRLEKLLAPMGYDTIVTYKTGLGTFEKFYQNRGPFQAIIMDVDPIREAFDLMMACIEDTPKEHTTKVVVLSESPQKNELIYFYSKGVDDVILKPFNDDVIYKKLSLTSNDNNKAAMAMVKHTLTSETGILKWCSDFEIGVEEVDREHKAIIDHFEKLYTYMSEGHGHEYYAILVEFLERYVNEHFSHEERLQENVHYPGIEAHKRMHRAFENQVKTLTAHHNENQVSNADLVKINLFIKNWLYHHLLVEDQKIGQYIFENPQLIQ